MYNLEYDYGEFEDTPCLLEYENEDYTVCARCEMGAVRIFTEEGVFCGHVYNDD